MIEISRCVALTMASIMDIIRSSFCYTIFSEKSASFLWTYISQEKSDPKLMLNP